MVLSFYFNKGDFAPRQQDALVLEYAVRGKREAVAQGVGVIDPDYRGEITVVLLNTSDKERRVRRGDRIAQLLFQPAFRVQLEKAEDLGMTTRGEGGFGHTGR